MEFHGISWNFMEFHGISSFPFFFSSFRLILIGFHVQEEWPEADHKERRAKAPAALWVPVRRPAGSQPQISSKAKFERKLFKYFVEIFEMSTKFDEIR